MRLKSVVSALALLALGACGGTAEAPVDVAVGPDPTLEAPARAGLLPTVSIPEITGWADGQAPQAAPGLKVQAFARGLDHPRWLYVLPNGDVLVAESNSPPRPKPTDLYGWIAEQLMKRAGGRSPSANRITLLRDADGDGTAELKTAFLTGLASPLGMALIGDRLFVANTDAIVEFPYAAGATEITAPPKKLTDLPGGPLNQHWTKNILASADGTTLYAAVGSNSNIGENGMDQEEGRAAIWAVDVATGEKRLYATGLRNPVGLDLEPKTGALWTSVNERDELGHNLAPDYMTSVQDGGFYGWPYSYFGQIVDTRVEPQNPDLVATAIKPDYALGAHTASLGLAFADGAKLGPAFAEGAFIGQHGSWNRNPPSGYKVIFVPFAEGKPSGMPVDVLTGFLVKGKARGRPAGVAVAKNGALLVADDGGDVIWRVSAE